MTPNNNPLVDAVGRAVPERLRDVYIAQAQIRALVRDVQRIGTVVHEHVETRDPVFALLNQQRFAVDYSNLRRTLQAAIAYAVCPYCGGESGTCSGCHGLGLVNRINYDHAPEALKK
jgi:hypothetical protein